MGAREELCGEEEGKSSQHTKQASWVRIDFSEKQVVRGFERTTVLAHISSIVMFNMYGYQSWHMVPYRVCNGHFIANLEQKNAKNIKFLKL